jgi:hypothetical protein
MGFKNPSNAFYSKAAVHERQAQHTEEVHFGLKIKRAGIFVFNGEDPSMEQINGHRVSQSHGVARGLAHGLIP